MLQTEQKMVKMKTVLPWNFSCLEYEANNTGEVTKIFCKVCREFFSTKKKSTDLKGRVQGQLDKYIEVSFFILFFVVNFLILKVKMN